LGKANTHLPVAASSDHAASDSAALGRARFHLLLPPPPLASFAASFAASAAERAAGASSTSSSAATTQCSIASAYLSVSITSAYSSRIRAGGSDEFLPPRIASFAPAAPRHTFSMAFVARLYVSLM